MERTPQNKTMENPSASSLFSRFNNFVADTADVLFEDTDEEYESDPESATTPVSTQSPTSSVLLPAEPHRPNATLPLSTPGFSAPSTAASAHASTTNNTPTASLQSNHYTLPLSSTPSASYTPNDVRNNRDPPIPPTTTPARAPRATTTKSTKSTVSTVDATITQSTIALLTSDLSRSQQEVQNLRSVLHTFSSNTEQAKKEGQQRLQDQLQKHTHALQLLTTEMVAAKQDANVATAREKECVARFTAKNELLQQELDQIKHQLRMAEARADDVERAEMVDRRLVRKVLLRYVQGGGGGGGGGGGSGREMGTGRGSGRGRGSSMGATPSSSAEDPVDLLAVILGLSGEQRSVLLKVGSVYERRRRVGTGDGESDGAGGLQGMLSFVSTIAGLQ